MRCATPHAFAMSRYRGSQIETAQTARLASKDDGNDNVYKDTLSILEDVTIKFKREVIDNNDLLKLSGADIDQFKTDICRLADELAVATKKNFVTTFTIRNEVTNKRHFDSENITPNNPDESTLIEKTLSTNVKKIIENDSKKYKSAETVEVEKKVSSIKMKLGKLKGNDDVEEMETVETEQTYKCPFTTMRFIQPMKNSECMHHISRIGLEQLLKSGEAASFVKTRTCKLGTNCSLCKRCPVMGCPSHWSKDSATYDERFDSKMERFFARMEVVKETEGDCNSSSSNRKTNVEEDYTEV